LYSCGSESRPDDVTDEEINGTFESEAVQQPTVIDPQTSQSTEHVGGEYLEGL